ncbi:MAG: GtrA family protein [Peptococcaceae bacterium]|nr:GtrA family protein [Peptococcaceae bacterium]
MLTKIRILLKEHPKIEQFCRYVLIGMSLVVIELVLFVSLSFVLKGMLNWSMPDEETANTTAIAIANFMAIAAGAAMGFWLNGKFTFRKASCLGRSVLLYILLFLFNNVFSTLTIGFLMSSFGLAEFVAKICTMPCIVLWNFVLYRKVIFV